MFIKTPGGVSLITLLVLLGVGVADSVVTSDRVGRLFSAFRVALSIWYRHLQSKQLLSAAGRILLGALGAPIAAYFRIELQEMPIKCPMNFLSISFWFGENE